MTQKLATGGLASHLCASNMHDIPNAASPSCENGDSDVSHTGEIARLLQAADFIDSDGGSLTGEEVDVITSALRNIASKQKEPKMLNASDVLDDLRAGADGELGFDPDDRTLRHYPADWLTRAADELEAALEGFQRENRACLALADLLAGERAKVADLATKLEGISLVHSRSLMALRIIGDTCTDLHASDLAKAAFERGIRDSTTLDIADSERLSRRVQTLEEELRLERATSGRMLAEVLRLREPCPAEKTTEESGS